MSDVGNAPSDSDHFSAGPIAWRLVDGIATLEMAKHPLNVFDQAMMNDMTLALGKLARRPALRAVVLRSPLKAFCAGVDVESHRGDKAAPTIKAFHRLLSAVEDFEVPTVAVVAGAAYGGGLELALACDIRVVAEEAMLGVPEIVLGVYPPYAIVRLPELIGRGRTARLVLTGQAVTGREAYEIGIADAIAPVAELEVEAAKLIGALQARSGSSLRIAKEALRAGHTAERNRLSVVEKLYFDRLMSTADADEGLVAFLEKRAPIWKHS